MSYFLKISKKSNKQYLQIIKKTFNFETIFFPKRILCPKISILKGFCSFQSKNDSVKNYKYRSLGYKIRPYFS